MVEDGLGCDSEVRDKEHKDGVSDKRVGSEASRATEINNFEKWKEEIVSSGKGL